MKKNGRKYRRKMAAWKKNRAGKSKPVSTPPKPANMRPKSKKMVSCNRKGGGRPKRTYYIG